MPAEASAGTAANARDQDGFPFGWIPDCAGDADLACRPSVEIWRQSDRPDCAHLNNESPRLLIDAENVRSDTHTMYAISIVATIFLPMSVLTDLLGINIGGMSGVSDETAF